MPASKSTHGAGRRGQRPGKGLRDRWWGGRRESSLSHSTTHLVPRAKGQGAPLWTPTGGDTLVWDGFLQGPGAITQRDNWASSRSWLWLMDAFRISGEGGGQPFTVSSPESSLEPQGPPAFPSPLLPRTPVNPGSLPPQTSSSSACFSRRELLQLQPLAELAAQPARP